MTNQEAYIAMIYFLEQFYEKTESDDVGELLGSMILIGNEETMDPALWNDWIHAVKKMELERQ